MPQPTRPHRSSSWPCGLRHGRVLPLQGQAALAVYDDSPSTPTPTARCRCCCVAARPARPTPATCSTCTRAAGALGQARPTSDRSADRAEIPGGGSLTALPIIETRQVTSRHIPTTSFCHRGQISRTAPVQLRGAARLNVGTRSPGWWSCADHPDAQGGRTAKASCPNTASAGLRQFGSTLRRHQAHAGPVARPW